MKSKNKHEKIIKKLGISDDAKELLRNMLELFPEKFILELDFAELSIFCQSWASLNDLYSKFKGQPLFYQTANGNFTAHPARDEMSMLRKQINKSTAKLGLSPADREKMKEKTLGRKMKGSSFLETLRNFDTE